MKTFEQKDKRSPMGQVIKWTLGLSLMVLPLGALAGTETVDVDHYKDELSKQIDQIKNNATAPQPTPAAKTPKAKKAKEKAPEQPAAEPEKKATPAPKKKTHTEEELEKLQAALDQLSKKVGGLEGAGSSFKFNLLLQGRGTVNDNPTVKVAGNNVYEGLDDSTVPGTVNDPFFFRRCEMKFSGSFANNSLQYVVMIDPVGVPAATKNLIQDYFLTYTPVKYLDLTVGQAKYPQGMEGRTSSAKLEFINRSTLGSSNGFGDQRDLMIQVSGTKVPLAQDLTFDYALAAVSGQGRNNAENNNNKDEAARLGLQYQGLWLGGSVYDGFEQAPGAATALEMWRVGLEAQWVLEGVLAPKDNLKFQGEWGQGSLVNENGSTKAAFSAASGGTGACGFYFEGLYRMDNTRVGVRYELWDPKDVAFSSPGTYQNYLTLGLDQYLTEDHLRVSLDWIHPILDNPAGGTLSVGEVIEAQTQLTL